MQAGGTRRLLVQPQLGWQKPGDCAATVDLGTFAAGVVPTAKVELIEQCIDTTKQPSPRTYQARRRLARRFDEALLTQVEVVQVR